jgi:hypothetical protein
MEQKHTKFTPKKVVVGTLFVFAFFFLYSYFSSNMRSMGTLGLSGSVTTASAPSFGYMPDSGGYAVREMSAKNMAMQVAAPGYDMVSDSYAPLPTSPAAPAAVSKIVKNGNLSLLVKSVDEAALAIGQLRASLMGQPGNENFAQYGSGGKRGDITIWVPSDRFEEAMSAIKKLALRVDNESVNVQDVSAQYVDLESRLKNLKAAEAQYQDIMKRSGKITEVLEVTRALNDTRAQIEQTQGQMDYLSRQVALSSIHINLTQEAIPGEVVSNEWRPFTVIKAAWRSTLSDLTDSIDMFLVLVVRLPVLIINLGFWALVIWASYRAGRMVYRKFSSTTAPSKDGV